MQNSNKKQRRAVALGLTIMYVTLSVVAPLASQHRHHAGGDAESSGYELHDAACDKHDIWHAPLSEHCTACKFLTTGFRLENTRALFSQPVEIVDAEKKASVHAPSGSHLHPRSPPAA